MYIALISNIHVREILEGIARSKRDSEGEEGEKGKEGEGEAESWISALLSSENLSTYS